MHECESTDELVGAEHFSSLEKPTEPNRESCEFGRIFPRSDEFPII